MKSFLISPLIVVLALSTASALSTANALPAEDLSSAPNVDALDFAQHARLSQKELANIRGQFIDANGLVLEFGVEIETQLNGKRIHKHAIDLIKTPDVSATTYKQNDVKKNGGLTQARYQIQEGKILNIVTQSQDNQTLSQQLDLNITIANFKDFQESQQQQRLIENLSHR